MEFSIEEFNPKKEELISLVEKYNWLSIDWIDDKSWYDIVCLARKNLKAKRVEIQKTWKAMRDEANKFGKLVIATEKSFIEIISPLEIALKETEDNYIQLVLIENRKQELPARKEQLIGLPYVSDDEILKLDDWGFCRLVFDLKQLKLKSDMEALEKAKIEIAQAEEEQRKKTEQQKLIEYEKEKVRLEEKIKAEETINMLKLENEKEKLRQEKIRADAEAEIRADAEKARIKAEEKAQKEIDKLKAEEDQKIVDVEKLRRNTVYIKFLSDSWYNTQTDKIERDWKTVMIYRILATIDI